MCHCSWVARRFGARADLSTALMSLACFRPRLRAVVPLVAAANFAADLHLFASLAVPLLATASFGLQSDVERWADMPPPERQSYDSIHTRDVQSRHFGGDGRGTTNAFL